MASATGDLVAKLRSSCQEVSRPLPLPLLQTCASYNLPVAPHPFAQVTCRCFGLSRIVPEAALVQLVAASHRCLPCLARGQQLRPQPASFQEGTGEQQRPLDRSRQYHSHRSRSSSTLVLKRIHSIPHTTIFKCSSSQHRAYTRTSKHELNTQLLHAVGYIVSTGISPPRPSSLLRQTSPTTKGCTSR